MEYLNANAWVASALLSVAFLGASLSMMWHMFETHSKPYNYLAVAGLLLMSLSFVLTGVIVGEQPIVTGRALLPLIRLLWLLAGLALNAYIVMYWGVRVKWKGRRDGTNE